MSSSVIPLGVIWFCRLCARSIFEDELRLWTCSRRSTSKVLYEILGEGCRHLDRGTQSRLDAQILLGSFLQGVLRRQRKRVSPCLSKGRNYTSIYDFPQRRAARRISDNSIPKSSR